MPEMFFFFLFFCLAIWVKPCPDSSRRNLNVSELLGRAVPEVVGVLNRCHSQDKKALSPLSQICLIAAYLYEVLWLILSKNGWCHFCEGQE